MTQVLAIDQGTTNSKAVLVDAAGRVLSRGAAPVGLHTPRPGWAEQDPEQLWTSVITAMTQCLQGHPHVDAVSISNQRESVLAWDRVTGAPLGPVIGWQDVRTADWCATPAVASGDALVRARTGLRIDPMFSAAKIRWLVDHTATPPDRIVVGTVDSWLVWRLTGGALHRCEAGNAARTLLYDVVDLAWSAELCDVFGIPMAVLPQVQPSTGAFGTTRGVPGLADGTPIVAVLADSHAALYAQQCRETGAVKATYGTGSSVMAPVASFHPGDDAVPSTLAWLTDGPQYAREGNIVSSGAALAWTARTLGLSDVPALIRLAGQVPDSGGVRLVPALAGLGAPHWRRDATALMTGMTHSSTPAHLARAAVDAVAHQICDVVDIIGVGDTPVTALRADGGATASPLLMQTQADLLGRPVQVAGVAELSALGAALLAFAVLGEQPLATVPIATTYSPQLSTSDRAQRRADWRDAVQLAISALATTPPRLP